MKFINFVIKKNIAEIIVGIFLLEKSEFINCINVQGIAYPMIGQFESLLAVVKIVHILLLEQKTPDL